MSRIAVLLALASVGGTGCQLVFDLGPPSDGPPSDGPPSDGPPKRPFGCSPASLFTDGFTDMQSGIGRPWLRFGNGSITTGTETGSGLELRVMAGFLEAVGEPFLELREQEFSVKLGHSQGNPNLGDRVTLDLVTEDGLHRLSYGLIARDPSNTFRLVAEYDTFDTTGAIQSTTLIGETDHSGDQDFADLLIRHQGEVTTFHYANPATALAERFTTDLAPLDWIAYMRPRLRVTSGNLDNTYYFENFNGSGAPVGEACPASTISETFDDDLSTEWQRVTPNNDCTIAVDAGGDLRMSFSEGNAVHDCIIHTSTFYDLRDHQVELKIAEVFPAASTFVTVDLEVETRTRRGFLRLDVAMSKLTATYNDGQMDRTVGETSVDLTNFGPSSVWRLSGTANNRLVFEVGDGDTFQPLGATQLGDLGALDAVRISVRAQGAGVGANAVARFSEIRSQ